MSTEKKLSPCNPQNNTSPQWGRWRWTASGSETPPRSSLPMVLNCLPLVVTNPTWPQTLKASQRLKLCFLIKRLQDCTKHWNGKKQPKEKKANRVIKHKHSNPSDSCSYFMTVTTAKINDTTTTPFFVGWSSWTLPGNHQECPALRWQHKSNKDKVAKTLVFVASGPHKAHSHRASAATLWTQSCSLWTVAALLFKYIQDRPQAHPFGKCFCMCL